MFYKTVEDKLKKLSEKSHVLITTVPQRCDASFNDPTHDGLAMVNNYMRELAVRLHKVHLIDLDVLKRFHFTAHGLHLNHRGKKKLSLMILTD